MLEEVETTSQDNNFFDRQKRIQWWDQKKLSQARVMVVGAGALGNEVLKNLALIGVGNLFIIDFDIIEDSNLSRSVLFRQSDIEGETKAKVAADRIRKLSPNPDLNVSYLHGDLVWELGAGVYRHVDLVIGCLDNVEARRVVNENCWKAGISWIDAGMRELSGSVAIYDASEEKACYECTMGPTQHKMAEQRYSCTNQTVKTNIRQGREPTTQTTSAIIASLQTQEAIKVLHRLPVPAGHRIIYHGYFHNFLPPDPTVISVNELTVNPDCFCHLESQYKSNVIEVDEATAEEWTPRHIFKYAQDKFNFNQPVLALGRAFVLEANCLICGTRTELLKPLFKVTDTEVACPSCEVTCPRCKTKSVGLPDCPDCGQPDINERQLKTLYDISLAQEDKFLDYSLSKLGIPPFHILEVTEMNQNKQILLELTGDLNKLFQ